MPESGHLFVIAAPSGTGKTTLVKTLVEAVPKITVSISHITRAKRPAETHGVNYYFVEKSEFQRMIKQGELLEYATVFGNYYGTSRRFVEERLQQGIDVILEIDWQGHQQIRRLFPNMISIFILPPSLEGLKERLIKRQQDGPEIIQQRLKDVTETMSHIHEFDYVVFNDNFDHALAELKTIIEAIRLRTPEQTKKYKDLISELVTISTE